MPTQVQLGHTLLCDIARTLQDVNHWWVARQVVGGILVLILAEEYICARHLRQCEGKWRSTHHNGAQQPNLKLAVPAASQSISPKGTNWPLDEMANSKCDEQVVRIEE